jgi:hypothetical protein
MRNCAIRAVLVVGAACVVAYATVMAIQWWKYRPQRFTLLEYKLPTGDTIGVGYVARWNGLVGWCPAWLYPRHDQWYEYLLFWQRGGRQRIYKLGEPYPFRFPLELRARTDWKGVWLVDRTTERADILASLDLATGECLDVNQMPADSRGTIPLRSDPRLWAEHHPKWATPDGGVLLGQCPVDPPPTLH